MTETQHTPGPWQVPEPRLIDAAPDLLDALKHIEWAVTGFGDFEAQYPDALAAVRAAIAKATGQ